jgi:hypothetical protein
MKRAKTVRSTAIILGIVIVMGALGFFFVQQSSFAFEDFYTYSDFSTGVLNPQEWRYFDRESRPALPRGFPLSPVLQKPSFFAFLSHPPNQFVPPEDFTLKGQRNIKGHKVRLTVETFARTGVARGEVEVFLARTPDASPAALGGCTARIPVLNEQREQHPVRLDWSLNEKNFSLSVDGREQCEGSIGDATEAYLTVHFRAQATCCLGNPPAEVEAHVTEVGYRPILGCALDPTDMVVYEVKNPGQSLSIFTGDLRWSFPNGGFKRLCVNLPAVLVRQGAAGVDLNAEIYGRLANGEIIPVSELNVENVGIFYTVDNRIANIPVTCTNGQVYNAQSNRCEHRNGIVLTGQGGVFNAQTGTFSFTRNLPCGNRPEFNLIITDPVNGQCPNEGILVDRRCVVCQQNPSVGGICLGTIDPQGRCLARPVFECPQGSIPIERDAQNNIIRCQVQASGQTVPVVENLQPELEHAQSPTRGRLRNAGIFLAVAIPMAILVIVVIALSARKRRSS